jgi:hypothetical protein
VREWKHGSGCGGPEFIEPTPRALDSKIAGFLKMIPFCFVFARPPRNGARSGRGNGAIRPD